MRRRTWPRGMLVALLLIAACDDDRPRQPTPTPATSPTPAATAVPTLTPSPQPATPTASALPTETSPPALLPVLVSSDPPGGSAGVPVSAWIRLDFAAAVGAPPASSFDLRCGGVQPPFAVFPLRGTAEPDASTLVLNPENDLPAGVTCDLSWNGPAGAELLRFSTAPAAAMATAICDRTNPRLTTPFPDDYWLVPDSGTATGVRVDFPVPPVPAFEQSIYAALLEGANTLDGFSPIAHFVVETSAPLDPDSLPHTAAESLDPLASVGLYNLGSPPAPGAPCPTSGCQDFSSTGQRIPFELQLRTDTSVRGVVSHTMLIFPSIPLTPGGHYGLVVTRRALTAAGQPLDPSPFTTALLGDSLSGDAAEVQRARPLLREVLDTVRSSAALPIPDEDVALAVRISIRTIDDIPSDLLAIKSQVLAAPPPATTVESVAGDSDPHVAAVVTGTWQAPDWRDGLFFSRDAGGLPQKAHSAPIAFTLALPAAALGGPVPVIMYQHGNPGSSEAEVPRNARRGLAEAGFAVIGFTDPLNREVTPGVTDDDEAAVEQTTAVLLPLLQSHQIPDYFIEANAEQIAFVRMIQGLGDLDILPIGAPDGVPDLDIDAPLTYVGISDGANHAPAFLPYAPEIRAAALVVGSGRLAETLIHQQAQALLEGVGGFFPNLTPADLWMGFTLFQMIFDRQDPHNYAGLIYRNPLPIAGDTAKASILLTEGLDDPLVPNNATDSLAWEIGPLPHVRPVQRPVPYLTPTDAPISANIDGHTTAAFYQFVPAGVSGVDPTPGCVNQPSGHFCPQTSAEGMYQRVVFLQSALSEMAPRVVDPLAR